MSRRVMSALGSLLISSRYWTKQGKQDIKANKYDTAITICQQGVRNRNNLSVRQISLLSQPMMGWDATYWSI